MINNIHNILEADIQTTYNQIVENMADDNCQDYKTIQAVRQANYVEIMNVHIKYKIALNTIINKIIELVQLEYQKQLDTMYSELEDIKNVVFDREQKIKQLQMSNIEYSNQCAKYHSSILTQNDNKQQSQSESTMLQHRVKQQQKQIVEQLEQIDKINIKLTELTTENLQQQMTINIKNEEIQQITQLTTIPKEFQSISIPESSMITDFKLNTLDEQTPINSTLLPALTSRIGQSQGKQILKQRRSNKQTMISQSQAHSNINEIKQQYKLPPVYQSIQDTLQHQRSNTRRAKQLNDILLYSCRKKQNQSVDHYYEAPTQYKFNVKDSLSSIAIPDKYILKSTNNGSPKYKRNRITSDNNPFKHIITDCDIMDNSLKL